MKNCLTYLWLLLIAGPAASQSGPARPEVKLKPLKPGKIRLLESYPTERRPDGFVDFDFLVLEPTRPLRFAAGGPGSVMLVVRGFTFGPVGFKLESGDQSDSVSVKLTPLLSRSLPLKIPGGTRVISLTPDTRVMVRLVEMESRPAPAPRAAEPVPKKKKPSPFWKYESDRPGLRGPDEPEEKSSLGFWATAGVGGGAQLGPTVGGFVFGGSLNLRIDSLLLQLRTSLAQQMEDQETGPLPSESSWEVGVLAGYGLRGTWGWFSGSAGIGIVGGVKRGEFLYTTEDTYRDIYEQIDMLGVGFPLDLQVFFTPFSCLGLGLQGVVNLNFKRSFFGVLMAVQLGEF